MAHQDLVDVGSITIDSIGSKNIKLISIYLNCISHTREGPFQSPGIYVKANQIQCWSASVRLNLLVEWHKIYQSHIIHSLIFLFGIECSKALAQSSPCCNRNKISNTSLEILIYPSWLSRWLMSSTISVAWWGSVVSSILGVNQFVTLFSRLLISYIL